MEGATKQGGLMIRRATESDVAAVVRLERETATAPHWSEAEYVAMLSTSGAAGLRRGLFVAVAAGTLGGFAVGKVLRMGAESESELESVVVRADLRRHGMGGSLCRAVMEWARGEGARKMLLEVRAGSLAVQIYRGLGFLATGRRPEYYENPVEDAVLMCCEIASQGSKGTVPEGDPGASSGRLDV